MLIYCYKIYQAERTVFFLPDYLFIEAKVYKILFTKT